MRDNIGQLTLANRTEEIFVDLIDGRVDQSLYVEAFLDDRMTHIVVSHALSILNHQLGSLIDEAMT